jgi:hypothetical protein
MFFTNALKLEVRAPGTEEEEEEEEEQLNRHLYMNSTRRQFAVEHHTALCSCHIWPQKISGLNVVLS